MKKYSKEYFIKRLLFIIISLLILFFIIFTLEPDIEIIYLLIAIYISVIFMIF